jgi:hypothetical protein
MCLFIKHRQTQIFMNNNNTTSTEYIYICADIIRADKNISEETIILMFLKYGQLLLDENKTTKDR